MNTHLKATLVAAGLALPMAAPAVANMDDIRNGEQMLRDGLENEMADHGIEAGNIDDLTLSEIAQIRAVLSDDESSDTVKQEQLEEIVEG